MSGVLFALAAGVGFGLFQTVNRRVNQQVDAYRATFALLTMATVTLAGLAIATQDLTALADTSLNTFGYFAGAGIVHFFFGWTFLSLSQQRVGASRTGVAIAATPLIGSVLAAILLSESLAPITALGVLLVVGGLAVLARRNKSDQASRTTFPWFGLLAAVSWGTSPLFIRLGLEGLPSPLIGVSVGLAAATIAYAIALVATGRWHLESPSRGIVRWAIVAALLVSGAIASQWVAYDNIEVAVAITLMQVSTPVVILTAPPILGGQMETLTPQLVLGTILVMTGSIAVVLA